MIVLEGAAFGKGLGHEGEALMNEISALIKETLQSSLARFGHVRIRQEVCPHLTR